MTRTWSIKPEWADDAAYLNGTLDTDNEHFDERHECIECMAKTQNVSLQEAAKQVGRQATRKNVQKAHLWRNAMDNPQQEFAFITTDLAATGVSLPVPDGGDPGASLPVPAGGPTAAEDFRVTLWDPAGQSKTSANKSTTQTGDLRGQAQPEPIATGDGTAAYRPGVETPGPTSSGISIGGLP